MAVSIDRVYQKVLALANKEQRGYITPQEFNLFADQAQMEIFEQYFYYLNQWTRQHVNASGYADMVRILEEKISLFEKYSPVDNITVLNRWGDVNLKADLPDLYRLIDIRIKYPTQKRYNRAEEMTTRDFTLYARSPLGVHSRSRPVYIRYSHGYDRIKIYPYPVEDDGSNFDLSTADLDQSLEFVTILGNSHPAAPGGVSANGVIHNVGNAGRYFYFNQNEMNSLLGNDFNMADTINATIVREDANGDPFTVFSNVQLILWDNTSSNAVGDQAHGRRDPYSSSEPDDFQIGDKIYITSNVYQTSNKRNVRANYIKKPKTPNWNYVVVNEKPLYNASTSIDFELHPSEESELVYRILAFAGIAIEKPQLTQVAANLEMNKVQQEKQ